MRSLPPLLAVFALAACGSTPETPAPLATFEPTEAADTLSARNAKTLGWLTAAGQPSREDLETLAASGTQCVINMRTAEEMSELDLDEAARVRELGMRYVSLPVSGAESLTDEFMAEARKALRECRHGGVLMH
ncbi:MAG: sulfur transferase domain-containing protein [Planctomycetota bacterium]